MLTTGALEELRSGWKLRREVTHGSNRYDFRLTRAGRVYWVEVKSVTWVEDGIGLFPDAPTARGVRHVESLAALAAEPGVETLVLFVVQRGDAREVRPGAAVDPAFATALAGARRAGVRLRAAVFRFDSAAQARFVRVVPVLPAAAGNGDGLP